MSEPAFICLTPVKDEAWILERFLRCAATWADHIVIADQMSEDGSREIAQRHEKVTLVDNRSDRYDEQYRQQLLLDTARSLPVEGKRILIALDADEALSANWMTSPEWSNVSELEPGTIIGFKWANLLSDFEKAWMPPDKKWFGFVDDGSSHDGWVIHSPRVPEPEGAPRVVLDDIKVLHYKFADWDRMRSRERFYHAWEAVHIEWKRPITLFRQYNQAYGIPPDEIHPVRDEWFEEYERMGIDMRYISTQDVYRWDHLVLDMLEQHGPEYFRKIDIWDVDWEKKARMVGRNGSVKKYSDPRSNHERTIHNWLRRTQPRAFDIPVRIVQNVLRVSGW